MLPDLAGAQILKKSSARRCKKLEFFSEIRRFLTERTCGDNLVKAGDSPDDSSPMAKGKAGASAVDVSLQITGLRRCAKFLSGRRRWSKRCSEMRDEIVARIRQEALRTGARDLAMVVLS